MWWLGIPVAFGLGKLLRDVATAPKEAKPSSSTSPDSILALNLRRLYLCTINFHPRRVAFMGQPGAGKSTILKKLSNGRAKPEPVIGAHTDATNWAESSQVTLLSEWDGYVAADVPGYDTSAHPASTFIESFPFGNFGKILLIMRDKVRDADSRLYQQIRARGVPVIIVRSCAESLNSTDRQMVREDFCKQFAGLGQRSIIFVSSRTGEGFEKLQSLL